MLAVHKSLGTMWSFIKCRKMLASTAQQTDKHSTDRLKNRHYLFKLKKALYHFHPLFISVTWMSFPTFHDLHCSNNFSSNLPSQFFSLLSLWFFFWFFFLKHKKQSRFYKEAEGKAVIPLSLLLHFYHSLQLWFDFNWHKQISYSLKMYMRCHIQWITIYASIVIWAGWGMV